MAKSMLGDMFSKMARDIRLKTDQLPSQIADIMEEIGEEQADEIRSFITTRPARTSGENGRVRTWSMYDAVGTEFKIGKSQVSSRVGYIDGAWEDHFYYQDAGFEHNYAGWVEGTNALGESYVRARERFIKAMGELGLKGGI